MKRRKVVEPRIEIEGSWNVVWLLPLFALIAPVALWPIEVIFPWPFVIEEIVKMVFVWVVLVKVLEGRQAMMTLVVGFLLAMSETMMFLMNVMGLGSMTSFWWRLMLTVPMHMGTTWGMYWFGRRGQILVGLGLGMVVHFLFNVIVS